MSEETLGASLAMFRCLGPFLHRWEKWQDGQWKITRLLTMADGVPYELWGTNRELTREGQSRACLDCGRKQLRTL